MVVRHDTHLFLFWFAVFYLLNFFIVVSVGKLLIRQWKKWGATRRPRTRRRPPLLAHRGRAREALEEQPSVARRRPVHRPQHRAHGKVQPPPPRSGSSLMITAGGAALWLVGVGALVVVEPPSSGCGRRRGGRIAAAAADRRRDAARSHRLDRRPRRTGVRRVARVLGPADERLYLGLRAVFVSRHGCRIRSSSGRCVAVPPTHTPPSPALTLLPPPQFMHDAMEAHTPEIEPSYLCLFATVFWMTYEHFPTLLLYSSLAWLALLYCFLHMTRAYVSLRHGASKLITARGGLATLERGNPHVRLTRWADGTIACSAPLERRDGRAFKVVFMLSLVHLALTQALWFFLAYKKLIGRC